MLAPPLPGASLPSRLVPERPAMQLSTNPTINRLLNSLLPIEWTVSTLYQRQATLLRYLGITKLADKFEAESLEERHHAGLLLDRMRFLEIAPEPLDTPVKTLANVPDGTDPMLMLEESLTLEQSAADQYRTAITTALEARDHGTRETLETILRETEEHVRWLEEQLNRARLIGRENFLTEWS